MHIFRYRSHRQQPRRKRWPWSRRHSSQHYRTSAAPVPRWMIAVVLLLGVGVALAWWFGTRSNRTLPGSSREPELTSRVQALQQERQQLDATVWSQEVLAQQYERPFIRLWDAMRAAEDRWAVLEDFPCRRFHIGSFSPPEPLERGIERRTMSNVTRPLSRDAWHRQLASWRQQGFEIVESEWHHAGFETDGVGQAQSQFNFVLHVRRSAARPQDEIRAIVRGMLVVQWSDQRDLEGDPLAEQLELRDVELLTRRGEPAFRPVLHYQRREQDYASAHPLLLQDLDGNGYSDIILSRWNRVYWNEGNGRFREDRLLDHFVPHFETGLLADLTSDGQADLITVDKRGHLLLFAGDAEGRFPRPSQICAEPRLEFPSAITAGDVDGDGDLDLFVSQYKLSYQQGQMPTPYYDANDGHPAYLLINDGQGRFVDATDIAGLASRRHRRTYSCSLVDLDHDQDLDLLVVSDFAGLDLYENDGRGNFRDVTQPWVDQRHLFGMAHTLGDFNGDGQLDLYAIGMSSTTARRLEQMRLGRSDRPDVHRMRRAMAYGNRLYLGQQGRFVPPPMADQVARSGWSWGTTNLDFDLDGDRDLYVANGFRSGQSSQDYCTHFWRHDLYTGTSRPDPAIAALFSKTLQPVDQQRISWNGYEHNVLWLNQDGERFTNVAFLMGVSHEYDARAVAGQDLDGDGRPDLLVTQYAYDGRGFIMDLHVYQNILETGHHWLGLRLHPTRNSRSPLGARITLHQGERVQAACLVTGDSFMTQHDQTVLFGLGQDPRVDRLLIAWPHGPVQEVLRPAADRYHRLTPPPRKAR